MARLESLADAPGTLREYETIYIMRPNTTNESVAELNKRVRGIIEGMGGKIVKVDNWGKRRLSYEVKKERKGIYLYWQYLAGSDTVAEFERNMRMLDSVVRYMTVKVDADVDPEVRPLELDDESFERAANTAADEEDVMLGHAPIHRDDDDDDDDDDYIRADDADDRTSSRSSRDSDSDGDGDSDGDSDSDSDSDKDEE
jgi:small subunit ribosomal protein S6